MISQTQPIQEPHTPRQVSLAIISATLSYLEWVLTTPNYILRHVYPKLLTYISNTATGSQYGALIAKKSKIQAMFQRS